MHAIPWDEFRSHYAHVADAVMKKRLDAPYQVCVVREGCFIDQCSYDERYDADYSEIPWLVVAYEADGQSVTYTIPPVDGIDEWRFERYRHEQEGDTFMLYLG